MKSPSTVVAASVAPSGNATSGRRQSNTQGRSACGTRASSVTACSCTGKCACAIAGERGRRVAHHQHRAGCVALQRLVVEHLGRIGDDDRAGRADDALPLLARHVGGHAFVGAHADVADGAVGPGLQATRHVFERAAGLGHVAEVQHRAHHVEVFGVAVPAAGADLAAVHRRVPHHGAVVGHGHAQVLLRDRQQRRVESEQVQRRQPGEQFLVREIDGGGRAAPARGLAGAAIGHQRAGRGDGLEAGRRGGAQQPLDGRDVHALGGEGGGDFVGEGAALLAQAAAGERRIGGLQRLQPGVVQGRGNRGAMDGQGRKTPGNGSGTVRRRSPAAARGRVASVVLVVRPSIRCGAAGLKPPENQL